MNKFKPRVPLRPQGRIQGLRASTPASYRSPSPAMLRSTSPAIVATVPPPRRGPTPCEQCGQTNFIEDGGQVICENCGAVSIDNGNFANDVVFGETDSGRTQQVGTRVNEGQTHQRTFMPRNQPLGRVGHEAMHTSEKAKLEADSTFSKFAMLLGIRQKEKNSAGVIFQMAYGNGFVRGRTIESVAIVCLYLATRRAKDANPPYSLMLIDFAEPANINVFDLGRMMQDMVKRLYLGGDGKLAENESILLRAPGAEVLIEKFVKHLDFGHDEYKVRKDATKILQRMKKDWLHDGRRPSGVCGAAVILAARMNNYRRTLREVVLCAKVTELTVNKRLEEFKYTDSSKLSVNDFRDDDVRDALQATDPPAFYRASQPVSKKKRKRSKGQAVAETAAEIEGDDNNDENNNTDADTGEPPQKRSRVDADGFAVPSIPTRSNQQPEAKPVRRGPGKPKGSKNWKAPPPTAAEIAYEAEMEHEIQEALNSNQELDEGRQRVASESVEPIEPTAIDVTPYQHDHHPRFDPPGPPARSNDGNTGNVNMDPELGNTEFDDDPEVSNCILSEAEKALKERIWVTENAEWLRQENAKKVRRELKNKHLIEQGIDPEELERQKGKLIKRKDGARRSGRLGDVEYLKDDFHKKKKSIGENGEEVTDRTGDGVQGAQDGVDAGQAQVAVRKMFNQRGTFSRRINYKNLLDAYQLPSENSLSPSRSPTRDREDSVASVASAASSSTSQRRSGAIEWFHGRKTSQTRSRGSIAQEKRQARERLARQRKQQVERQSRSRSASGTPATEGEEDEEEEEAAEGTEREEEEEEEDEEQEIADQKSNKPATPQQQQLPTPRPTQQQQQQQRQPRRTRLQTANQLPAEEVVSDTDSPLSSTHTPHGFGTNSATNTPTNISRAQSEEQRQPLGKTDGQIKSQITKVSENDVSSDEGDYVNEDDEDDDEEEEEEEDGAGLDDAFAGRYARSGNPAAAASQYEWEDEVVEDD